MQFLFVNKEEKMIEIVNFSHRVKGFAFRNAYHLSNFDRRVCKVL